MNPRGSHPARALASVALLLGPASMAEPPEVRCVVEYGAMSPDDPVNQVDLVLDLPDGYTFLEARFDVVNLDLLETGVFEQFGVPFPLVGSPGDLQPDNSILGIEAFAPDLALKGSVHLYSFRWFTTEFERRTVVFQGRLDEVVARTADGERVVLVLDDPICGWSFGGSNEDCIADWNGDTTVDIFDLLDFLDDFEGHDPATDINGDGEFDIFDVLDFLEIWGDACP